MILGGSRSGIFNQIRLVFTYCSQYFPIFPDQVQKNILIARIEKICYNLGIKSFTPLWHKDQELLLREQVNAGFKVIVVGVFAQGFNKSWLGRIIDEQYIDEIVKLHKKHGINTAGEGGELETLVIDGPIYKKKLILDEVSKEWKRDNGFLIVKKAHIA